MVSISNSPSTLPISPSQDQAAQPIATTAQGASSQPQVDDAFESLVARPFQEWLGQQGLTPSPGQEPRVFVIRAEQSSALNQAIHSGNVAASSEAFGRVAQGIESLGVQDVNALVQQVLRDAYMQNTEDLRAYAEKVKHFNEQKAFLRDHLSDLRSFTTKAREFAVSIGISQVDDRSTWSQDQVAKMDEFFATEATNGFSSAAFTMAHNRGVDTCMVAAQDLIQEAYGTPLPSKIESQLSDALTSNDSDQIKAALTVVAGYLSYLGDCSVKDGKFGQGGGYDDVHHITSEPSYEDFRHYMDDAENATARTNLHSGDVEIIEAAFGVDLGISGSTSVQGVVAAAMSPVNDKWAHQIVHGRVISTAEINQELATQGPDSQVALEIFGSSGAAAQAYWGGALDGSNPEVSMRLELGMANGVPPPGVSTIEQVDDEIAKWEDKLNTIGDDAQLANVDLQNMLQKQQQTLQMMSNISKSLHDTAMAVIRKMGG